MGYPDRERDNIVEERELTIYLLRHGETTTTVEGRFCGSTDPGLTDGGRTMAEAVAAAYRNVPWAGVYASPMRRVLETLAPLLRETGHASVIEEGFREIDYGTWEGRVVFEMEQEEPELFRYWAEDPGGRGAPGGENAYQVAARAMAAIERIRRLHPEGGNILIGSHKATIRVLLCCFLGIDPRRYRDRLDCPLASVARIRFGTYGPFVELLGDTSHLRSFSAGTSGT